MSRQFGSRTPNVNASLIREARMIFQQLHAALGSPKVDRVQSEKKPEKTHIIALTCEPCLRSSVAMPEPAITVSKGFAVCHRHLLMRD